MSKTIAKNRHAEVFARATGCTAFTLSNGFQGEACDPARAREALEAHFRARLERIGEDRYRVQVHSNCWYEIRVRVP